jgi:hypothetical protein
MTKMATEAFQVYRDQPASLEAIEKFEGLECWLCSNEAMTSKLQDLEQGAQSRGRELLRCMLQAHVNSRGDGDVGELFKIRDLSGRQIHLTHKRVDTRSVVTIFGRVEVRRIGYSLPGMKAIHPLDRALQLPARSYSYTLQKRLVTMAAHGPFDLAVQAVEEPTGIHVPKRTAEQILIESSVDFDEFYATRKGSEKEYTPLIVGSIDCKGIPMVKKELAEKPVRRRKGEKAQTKRMATVAAVFGQWPRVRTPEEVVDSLFNPTSEPKLRMPEWGPQRKRVWASLKASKDAFVNDVREEMRRRDPKNICTHVIVTDGERALQLRVIRTISDAILILDLFHALEKLWAVGYALLGEDSPLAQDFVRQRTLAILQGKVSQVVKGFRKTLTKRRLSSSQRKILSNTAEYLYKNRSKMRYHEYLAKGYPIASGSVEGACKNLIKDRMERSGMRWTTVMAEAMVKTRALFLSEDFDPYWTFHVACEQKRLHPHLTSPNPSF